jgi:hypothetical protein
MDIKHFELLLRKTSFCNLLLCQTWENLNTIERIELLLHLTKENLVISKDLLVKAIEDKNPVVRMLTVKCSHISEDDDPELYAKIKSDQSSVKAALHDDYLPDEEELFQLTHIERLGVIALAKHISGETFTKIIINGIRTQSISEDEARELVVEFVRNPNIIGDLKYEPMDGLDWYTQRKEFESIWRLTTCTSPKVHNVVAWEYPLVLGEDNTFPDDMLDSMSNTALTALVWRRYAPLLKRISEFPERFDSKIHDEVKKSATH